MYVAHTLIWRHYLNPRYWTNYSNNMSFPFKFVLSYYEKIALKCLPQDLYSLGMIVHINCLVAIADWLT